MATLISKDNISQAWLAALALLVEEKEAVNLAVAIRDPLAEDKDVRAALDRFIDCKRKAGVRVERVSTVANTIFPQELYLPRLAGKARQHLYEMHALGARVSKRTSPKGTYFGRMVAWPGVETEVNQLEKVVLRLRANKAKGHTNGNALEIGLAVPSDGAEPSSHDIRIQAPGKDTSPIGFPCLSHISLTLSEGKLHLTALYRNHDFAKRAYGNYVGLGRVLNFLAVESGYAVGELLCVSTHAQVAIGSNSGFGKGVLLELMAECAEAGAVAGKDAQ
jgi:hypothetical protein